MKNLPVSALPNLAGSVLTLAGKRKPHGHAESGSLSPPPPCRQTCLFFATDLVNFSFCIHSVRIRRRMHHHSGSRVLLSGRTSFRPVSNCAWSRSYNVSSVKLFLG